MILDVPEHVHRYLRPLDERVGEITGEPSLPLRATGNMPFLEVCPGAVEGGKPGGKKRHVAPVEKVDVPASMCRLTFGLIDGQQPVAVVGVHPLGIRFVPFILFVRGLAPGIVESGNDGLEG